MDMLGHEDEGHRVEAAARRRPVDALGERAAGHARVGRQRQPAVAQETSNSWQSPGSWARRTDLRWGMAAGLSVLSTGGQTTRAARPEGIHSGSGGRGALTTAWNPAPSSTNGPPGDAGGRSTPCSATATLSAPCSATCLSSLR